MITSSEKSDRGQKFYVGLVCWYTLLLHVRRERIRAERSPKRREYETGGWFSRDGAAGS